MLTIDKTLLRVYNYMNIVYTFTTYTFIICFVLKNYGYKASDFDRKTMMTNCKFTVHF